MSGSDERFYAIICLDDYDIDWEQLTIRDVRDSFMRGLRKNVKYLSVVNKHGENMVTTKGHQTECLDDEEWLEVFDEEGNLDIEETANVITKDFIDNAAIIAMRFKKDMYDELGKDKGWLDRILDDV